jgi:ABC-type multidrug transport system fused ATPase/permease subunit
MPPGGRMGGPMGQFLTEEEKKNQPKVTPALLKRVFSYLKPYTKQLILVLLCIIVSSFFTLLPSIISGKILDEGLMKRDIQIVSGGTDNHLMVVDLTNYDLTGKEVEAWLDEAHITANKNTIPNEKQSPFVTSGIRLGTPAVTTRGMNTEDMDKIAEAIATVIKKKEAGIEEAKAIVKSLTDKYPLI